MIIIMQHTIYSKSDKMKLILGDCIEKMKELLENSIDAIITDPLWLGIHGEGLG